MNVSACYREGKERRMGRREGEIYLCLVICYVTVVASII